MGTRADFYIGRGDAAEWLGSISMDGYPEGDPEGILGITDVGGFRSGVTATIEAFGHGTTPDLGWPWPWASSHTTDWAYMFEGGEVWVSCFGHTWVKWVDYDADLEYGGRAEVPDMSAVQNVTIGPRSGVIVAATGRRVTSGAS